MWLAELLLKTRKQYPQSQDSSWPLVSAYKEMQSGACTCLVRVFPVFSVKNVCSVINKSQF